MHNHSSSRDHKSSHSSSRGHKSSRSNSRSNSPYKSKETSKTSRSKSPQSSRSKSPQSSRQKGIKELNQDWPAFKEKPKVTTKNEKLADDIDLDQFDHKNENHITNLKDQLRRLRNQQIQVITLIHEGMKKNEKDNEARIIRHTEMFRKTATTLVKGNSDESVIKKKLDELKSIQVNEDDMALQKQKHEFHDFDVIFQRKLKDMEDIVVVLGKHVPSYKGDLTPSSVDHTNPSHVKYANDQLSRFREEELDITQQLFTLRLKHGDALNKLSLEQNEKFARILRALVTAKLGEDTEALKTDQMKAMLERDWETMAHTHRDQYRQLERDLAKTIQKVIDWEHCHSLLPVRKVPSAIMLGCSTSPSLPSSFPAMPTGLHDHHHKAGDGDATGRESDRKGKNNGGTHRSDSTSGFAAIKRSLSSMEYLEKMDKKEKGDIALADFDAKNAEHVINLKQQLKRCRVHELQLHQKIHELMKEKEEENDRLSTQHAEQFKALETELQLPSVTEEQVKARFEALRVQVDNENSQLWKREKEDYHVLDKAMRHKLKEIADIESLLFKHDPILKEPIPVESIVRTEAGHIRQARHTLGKLKLEEVELQAEMNTLRTQHLADLEHLIETCNDRQAQLLAQLKRGGKTEEQMVEPLLRLRVKQNAEKNQLFKKQKEQFTKIEQKMRDIFQTIIAYERAISSNNMRSLTALFPLRRIFSDVIKRKKKITDVNEDFEEEEQDDADTQLKKLNIRRLRQEELKIEDRIHHALRKQEKYNGHVEQDQAHEVMMLLSEMLLNDEPESEVKLQSARLRKMITDDDAVIRTRQRDELERLLHDLRARVREVEQIEDDIARHEKKLGQKIGVKEFDPKNHAHVYNMQLQIRALRAQELDGLTQLSALRAEQWGDNQTMLLDHYDRFGKIQRGLTRAKLSDDMVNLKSEQMRDVLGKDKDEVFAKQKEAFRAVEDVVLGNLKKITELERTIQGTTNINTRFTYDPIRRVPDPIDLARPSPIQFVSWKSQKEMVSKEVPAPKLDFDKVGDPYKRLRAARQEELAIEYRIHLAMKTHEKYNAFVIFQQNRKCMRIAEDLIAKKKPTAEVAARLEQVKQEHEGAHDIVRLNQKEEIDQLKGELKQKIREVADIEHDLSKGAPVVQGLIDIKHFEKKNPGHVANLQEQLQDMRLVYLDMEGQLFDLRNRQQEKNQKMVGRHNFTFELEHIKLASSHAPEKDVVDKCTKLLDTLEAEKDAEFEHQKKEFAALEDPLLRKARNMGDLEKTLQTASDEYWYAYFPSRKAPERIELLRPGPIAYNNRKLYMDDGEDDEMHNFDPLYRRPPPDSAEMALKKLRLKEMRNGELELLDRMHRAMKNQEKYNAMVGKKHSEEFLRMLTSEMNRPEQTYEDMRVKNEEWKKVFEDERGVIRDNQCREFNELVKNYTTRIKQISDLEDDISKDVARMEKTLPLNRFDPNSASHVYNLQQQLQKQRQDIGTYAREMHDLRMQQQKKNEEMANMHNEKFSLLQQGLVETGLNEEEVKERSEQMRTVLEKDKDKMHDKHRDEFLAVEDKLHRQQRETGEVEKTIQSSNTNTHFIYEPARRVPSRIWLIRPAESSYDPYGIRPDQGDILPPDDFRALDKLYGRKFIPGKAKKEKEKERSMLLDDAKKLSELNHRFWELRMDEMGLDDKLHKMFRCQERFGTHLLRDQNERFIADQAPLLLEQVGGNNPKTDRSKTDRSLSPQGSAKGSGRGKDKGGGGEKMTETAYVQKLEALNYAFDVENKMVRRNMEDETASVVDEMGKKLKELASVENKLFKGAPVVPGEVNPSKFDHHNKGEAANLQRQLQALREEVLALWKRLFDLRMLKQYPNVQALEQDTNVKFGTLQLGIKKASPGSPDVVQQKSEQLALKLDGPKEDMHRKNEQQFREIEKPLRDKYHRMGEIEAALRKVGKDMEVMYAPVHTPPKEVLRLFPPPGIAYDPDGKRGGGLGIFPEDEVYDDDDDDDEGPDGVVRRKGARIRFEPMEELYKKALPPLPDTADIQLLKIRLKKTRSEELELEEKILNAIRHQERYNGLVAQNQCAEFMQVQSDMVAEEEVDEVILRTNAEMKQAFADNNATIRANERHEVEELEQALRKKIREIQTIENALNKDVPVFNDIITLESYNKNNSAHVYNLQVQIQGMREELASLFSKLHEVRMHHTAVNQEMLAQDIEQFAMLQSGLARVGLADEVIQQKSNELKATLEKEQKKIHEKETDEFEFYENRMHKRMRLLILFEAAVGESQTNTKFAYEPVRRMPERIVLTPPIGLQYDVLYKQRRPEEEEAENKDFDELNKIYGAKEVVRPLPFRPHGVSTKRSSVAHNDDATTSRNSVAYSDASTARSSLAYSDRTDATTTARSNNPYNDTASTHSNASSVGDATSVLTHPRSVSRSTSQFSARSGTDTRTSMFSTRSTSSNRSSPKSYRSFTGSKRSVSEGRGGRGGEEKSMRGSVVGRDFRAADPEANVRRLGDEGDDTYNYKVRVHVRVIDDDADEQGGRESRRSSKSPTHRSKRERRGEQEDTKEVQMLKAQLKNVRQQDLDLEKELFGILKKQEAYNEEMENDQNKAFLKLKDQLMRALEDDEEVRRQLTELLVAFEKDDTEVREKQAAEIDELLFSIQVKYKEMADIEGQISKGINALRGPPVDNIYDLFNPAHVAFLVLQMQTMRTDVLELWKALSSARFTHVEGNQKLFGEFNLKYYEIQDALLNSRLSDSVLKAKLEDMRDELEIDKSRLHQFYVEEFSGIEIRLHSRIKDLSNIEVAVGESNKYSKFAYEPLRVVFESVTLARPTILLFTTYNRSGGTSRTNKYSQKDFTELDNMYGGHKHK